MDGKFDIFKTKMKRVSQDILHPELALTLDNKSVQKICNVCVCLMPAFHFLCAEKWQDF